jgi:hypothetical protein
MLTNRGHNSTGEIDIVTYDLRSQPLRKNLNKLKFRCKIGKEFWHICLDKEGLCRKESECAKYKRKFFRKICIKRKERFLPLEDHVFLVQSGVYCFSSSRYGAGF